MTQDKHSSFQNSISTNEIRGEMTLDDSAFFASIRAKNDLFVLGNRCSTHLSYGAASGLTIAHEPKMSRLLQFRGRRMEMILEVTLPS